MKKRVLGLGMILILPICFIFSRDVSIDELAGAFAVVAPTEKPDGKEAPEKPAEKPAEKPKETTVISHSTKEQRDKRVQELREKIKNNLVTTPQEARDTLVEYLLVRFTELFTPLAEMVADAVKAANMDPKLVEVVRRLPGATSEAGLVIYTLFKEVFKKEYIAAIKALRDPVLCLFAKPGARMGLTDKEGAQICKDATLKTALLEVLEKGRPVLEPFVKAMVLGGKVGDQDVKGLVQIGLGTIDTKLGDEMGTLRPIFSLILDLPGQLKSSISE